MKCRISFFLIILTGNILALSLGWTFGARYMKQKCNKECLEMFEEECPKIALEAFKKYLSIINNE